jgi:hypothetical protein
MNNEPVAWMNIHGQFNKKETWLFPIPLYTHPAKELTDEEIKETLKIYYPRNADNHINDLVWFARALLKKASEK